jgi:copper chaperone
MIMEMIQIEIRDMHNSHSQRRVENAIKRNTAAQVHYIESGKASVSLSNERAIVPVLNAIRDAGYRIGRVSSEEVNTHASRQFKTNINCCGCLSKVLPVLNEKAGMGNWNIDVKSPDKILTIRSNQASADAITFEISKVGFTIESIPL